MWVPDSRCMLLKHECSQSGVMLYRRKRFWFRDTVVLLQTLALAASQVFATSLDSYFQLTITLMILVVGTTVLAHYQHFEQPLPQSLQVEVQCCITTFLICWTGGNCKDCY